MLKLAFLTPVISHWIRRQMRLRHWSEALSVLHVEGCQFQLRDLEQRTDHTNLGLDKRTSPLNDWGRTGAEN